MRLQSAIALLVVPGLWTGPDPTTRGTLMIRRGTDTLVVDRYERVKDSLRGRVEVKGQGRIDYLALLGAGETVRSLTIAAFAPGAAANAAPAVRARVVMQGDSAIVETGSGTQRLATKAGAVPMFNNALALTEIFTRRARAAGAETHVPYFATNGGLTLDVSLTPVGTDSIVMILARQTYRLKVASDGAILGGVIGGTGMEYVRGAVAEKPLALQLSDGTIAPKADYSAPRGAPYVAEEVRVPGPGGIMLAGTLTRPANASPPFAAVVTITGSGLQDRDELIPFAGGIRLFRQVADTLGRRGIAVLRMDDRGAGASGGDPRTATTADFADDIRAAIAYLRNRSDIDPSRIALVGHSEGGVIAPMIAASDHRLAAIVIMAGPAEQGIEISMAQNRFVVDRDSSLSPTQRDSLLRAARAALDPDKQKEPWLKWWLAYDPAPTARQVTIPVLILQGATDRQVPVDQADKLAGIIRSSGNQNVTVRVIPATNHLFVEDSTGDFRHYDRLRSNIVGANVLGPLADWLASQLARTALKSAPAAPSPSSHGSSFGAGHR